MYIHYYILQSKRLKRKNVYVLLFPYTFTLNLFIDVDKTTTNIII